MARFLLYRADSGRARVLGELVGGFTSLAAARSARDWDVLRQLERAHGCRVELGHAIVDRLVGGEPHRQVCSAAGLARRRRSGVGSHGSVATTGEPPGLNARPGRYAAGGRRRAPGRRLPRTPSHRLSLGPSSPQVLAQSSLPAPRPSPAPPPRPHCLLGPSKTPNQSVGHTCISPSAPVDGAACRGGGQLNAGGIVRLRGAAEGLRASAPAPTSRASYMGQARSTLCPDCARSGPSVPELNSSGPLSTAGTANSLRPDFPGQRLFSQGVAGEGFEPS